MRVVESLVTCAANGTMATDGRRSLGSSSSHRLNRDHRAQVCVPRTAHYISTSQHGQRFFFSSSFFKCAAAINPSTGRLQLAHLIYYCNYRTSMGVAVHLLLAAGCCTHSK